MISNASEHGSCIDELRQIDLIIHFGLFFLYQATSHFLYTYVIKTNNLNIANAKSLKHLYDIGQAQPVQAPITNNCMCWERRSTPARGKQASYYVLHRVGPSGFLEQATKQELFGRGTLGWLQQNLLCKNLIQYRLKLQQLS